MTQEEKELLFKDLSARFPYGIKIKDLSTQADTTIDVLGIKEHSVLVDRYTKFGNVYDSISIEYVRPYLRPMSSMTEEEKKEYDYCLMCMFYSVTHDDAITIDFLNSHHLDYHGLIPKGLALEEPEGKFYKHN